jgi:hypothetical protein
MNAHDEKPGPRLGQEPNGVHDKSANSISFFRQRTNNVREVPAIVRSERPDHVLQDDESRVTAMLHHLAHQFPKCLEGPASFAVQTRTGAR